MKFFGSKNKEETVVNDDEDINLDDVSLDEETADAGASIVPTGGPVALGGKKKSSFGVLAILGLLVVIGGGGFVVVTGGDFSVITGMLSAPQEDVVAPIVATDTVAIESPVMSAVDPLAVTTGEGFAVPVESPVPFAPPMPDAPIVAGPDALVVEDAVLPPPEGTQDAQVPNVVAVEAPAIPLAPVPEAVAPAVAGEEMPVPEVAPVTDATAIIPPPAPIAAVVPAEHMMIPAEEMSADEAAMNGEDKTAPQEILGVDMEATPPPPFIEAEKVVKVSEPSAAEKALVENAAVLDQLSQTPQAVLDNPATVEKTLPPNAALVAPAFQIQAEEAPIRDLPNGYFLLRKDKEASDNDQRLKAANRALADGNSAAAVEMYDRLRSESPKDEKVLLGRAIALQRMGQNTAAIDAYEEVLRTNPKSLNALTNMLGLLRKQSPDLALDKLKELHVTYPFNVGILAQLGTVYGDIGRYEEGHALLDQAIAMAPSNALYVFNKAVLYDRMGDAPHAAQMYRYCLDIYYQDGEKQAVPVEAIKKRLAAF